MSHTRINHFHVNNMIITRKGKLPSGGGTTDINFLDDDGNTLVITLFHDEPLVIQLSDESE